MTEECVSPSDIYQKKFDFIKRRMSNNSPLLTLNLLLRKGLMGATRGKGRRQRKLCWRETRWKVGVPYGGLNTFMIKWFGRIIRVVYPSEHRFPWSPDARNDRAGFLLSLGCTLTVSGREVNGTWPTPKAPGTVTCTLRASNQYFL